MKIFRQYDNSQFYLFYESFQSVSADLMTSKVNFANLKIENFDTTVKLAKSRTEIEASLKNFKIFDKNQLSLYPMIAECTGDQVLDVGIVINDRFA